MLHVRKGESKGVFYRSERVFCVNGEWYFATRERPETGPFSSSREARMELDIFLNQVLGVQAKNDEYKDVNWSDMM